MKTLKSFTLVALFLFASAFTTFAKDTDPYNTKDALRAKIVSMIGKQIPLEVTTKSIDAKVSFVINKNNEIVVVSVDSKNENLDSYIKNKLNYQKLIVPGTIKGEVYIFPLKVNKPS